MRDIFFRPGDTQCEHIDRNACLWRELSFALFFVRQAVNPQLCLAECLAGWNRIAAGLAEPTRNRKRQMYSVYDFDEL